MRHALTVLVLVAVVALSAPATATTRAGGPDDTGPLYLAPPDGDTRNLTTYPPGSAAVHAVEPDDVVVPRFMWTWTLGRSPSNWTLAEDAPIEALVHLEGLHRVVPVGELRSDASHYGRIRVQVDLFLGAGSTSDTGMTYIVDPTSYANATGHTYLDARLLGDDERLAVRVPVVSNGTFAVDRAWHFTVRITVSGAAAAEERPTLILGGTEAPTHITVPGYPWAGFRAWEDTERVERACLERLLLQQTCEEPAREPTPAAAPVVAESPAAPTLVLVGLVAVAAALGRAPHRGAQK